MKYIYLVLLLFLFGCNEKYNMTNEEIITETNKCREANMSIQYYSMPSSGIYRVECIDKQVARKECN